MDAHAFSWSRFLRSQDEIRRAGEVPRPEAPESTDPRRLANPTRTSARERARAIARRPPWPRRAICARRFQSRTAKARARNATARLDSVATRARKPAQSEL